MWKTQVFFSVSKQKTQMTNQKYRAFNNYACLFEIRLYFPLYTLITQQNVFNLNCA